MDRPIAVTWSLAPIDDHGFAEGASDTSHRPVLGCEIAYDDPTPCNVLRLGQANALTTQFLDD
jgi:hypothetical protein